MSDVCITEFTDPGCPWAWSAEPFRQRLSWIYGDALEWRTTMVVLAEDPREYEEKGFSPQRQSQSFKTIAAEHGMPIDTRERPRMAATAPACPAVIAAPPHAPQHERPLLRRPRGGPLSRGLPGAAATIAGAASDVGLDPAGLQEWMGSDDVEEAVAADKARAREPLPAAQVLDEKLANWSGGRRYTCPSYEITRLSDGVRIAVPGFQPFAAYDVVTANLVPGTHRRDPPETVSECLAWADCPLTTKEVAVLCDLDELDAREELGRVADEEILGADGFWTLSRPAA